ncbi:phosphatase PAP2 family protein [Candidatus Woesearchaeota archaeon]|nr:phosphatase PAP2 family protein [Candidatus Woesearchaeota archaeon]
MKRLISVIIVLLGLSLLFDSRILNFIIHYRISYLNYIFIFLTDFGPYIIFLFSTFILLYKKKLKLIPLLWLSFIIVFLLIELLKFSIPRPRPEVDYLIYSAGNSFPSRHAAIAFTPLYLINKNFPKFKWYFLSFACLIVFSRLYLGVHYLSDIIAGAFLGYILGLIISKLEYKKQFNLT